MIKAWIIGLSVRASPRRHNEGALWADHHAIAGRYGNGPPSMASSWRESLRIVLLYAGNVGPGASGKEALSAIKGESQTIRLRRCDLLAHWRVTRRMQFLSVT